MIGFFFLWRNVCLLSTSTIQDSSWATILSFNHSKRLWQEIHWYRDAWFFKRFSFVFVLHFSLEHGKTHTLHIPAVDNDGDKTKCEFSSYIEAGDFQFLVKNLTAANIVEMNDKEVCNKLLIWNIYDYKIFESKYHMQILLIRYFFFLISWHAR